MSEDPTRDRIVAAAIALLGSGGREALTTRAVAAAAKVQAPALYRLFGDKDGLLNAVAEHGFASYMSKKVARARRDDPVEDLRAGWDLHVEFGLANPAIYSIMVGASVRSPAALASAQILAEHIHRIAVAGRLRVAEARAAALVHAAGSGTVLTLLAMPPRERDLGLSEAAREAVIAAICARAPVVATPAPSSAAIALRAVLPDAPILTPGERALLEELLDRLGAWRA